MSRDEYLMILRNNLRNIPLVEADNIIEYYREYFDEAGEENTDTVIRELGSPQALAAKVSGDYSANNGQGEMYNNYQGYAHGNTQWNNQQAQRAHQAQYAQQMQQARTKNHTKAWTIVFAVVGFPIWFPLLITAAALIFALCITVLALLFAVLVSSVSVLVGGSCSVAVGIATLFKSVPTGVFLIGIGFVGIGCGILFYFALVLLYRLVKSILHYFFNKRQERKNRANGFQQNENNYVNGNNQNVNQNMNQNMDQNMNQSMGENMNQSMDENMNQNMDENMDQSIDQNMDQSVIETQILTEDAEELNNMDQKENQ